MEVRQAVALRGPGGLALISAAGRVWSGFRTMCLPARGLAVVWLVRGASARFWNQACPPRFRPVPSVRRRPLLAAVMIGVDPHKASHTAAAIGPAEEPLGGIRVRAVASQAAQLLAWAAAWPERTWAVEGATGLGNLPAQQLVTAGEVVLDVQPKMAARVRLLASGNTNKNDPNDARSVAVAALRSRAPRRVAAEDHTAVLKVWPGRYRDLGRARTQVACRLHAVLADLVPGGFSREITAGQGASMRKRIRPSGPAARARRELAAEFPGLRRLDGQIRDTRNKLAAAVQASGTT